MGVPRQLNSQRLPESESDELTGDSPYLAFVASVPQLENQGSGGDMVAYRDENSGANDASTLLNAMTTEPGNLALSWNIGNSLHTNIMIVGERTSWRCGGR